MIPLAVLDLLADDWVRSRKESARKFGSRPSRFAALFGSGRRQQIPDDVANVVAATTRTPSPTRRAA